MDNLHMKCRRLSIARKGAVEAIRTMNIDEVVGVDEESQWNFLVERVPRLDGVGCGRHTPNGCCFRTLDSAQVDIEGGTGGTRAINVICGVHAQLERRAVTAQAAVYIKLIGNRTRWADPRLLVSFQWRAKRITVDLVDFIQAELFVVGRQFLKTRLLDANNKLVSIQKIKLRRGSVVGTEAGGEVAADGASKCADVFFLDLFAELILHEVFEKHERRGMVEQLRVHPSSAAPRRCHDRGDSVAQADRSGARFSNMHA